MKIFIIYIPTRMYLINNMYLKFSLIFTHSYEKLSEIYREVQRECIKISVIIRKENIVSGLT